MQVFRALINGKSTMIFMPEIYLESLILFKVDILTKKTVSEFAETAFSKGLFKKRNNIQRQILPY
ncbi:MAG: hypothetical protein PUK76_00335 [Treponema sp.]|nr:hypothetical protein [Treponema sp.]